MSPQFSFITATYQSARYVRRCYWSLNRQAIPNWEWILVDDGSTDDTRAVVSALSDARVKYIRLDRNVGSGAARTIGLANASGAWCALQDIDDFCFPDRLSRAEMARQSGNDFLCSAMLLISPSGEITGVRGVVDEGYPRGFTHATVCGRTDLVRMIGYPTWRRAQDVRLVYTLANCYKGVFDRDPLYIYQEGTSGKVVDAIAGQYYFLKELNILTRRGVLAKGGLVRRMKIARIAKIAGLLPFALLPFLYKYTVRFRSSVKGDLRTVSNERLLFARECMKSCGESPEK